MSVYSKEREIGRQCPLTHKLLSVSEIWVFDQLVDQRDME